MLGDLVNCCPTSRGAQQDWTREEKPSSEGRGLFFLVGLAGAPTIAISSFAHSPLSELSEVLIVAGSVETGYRARP
jgi:hypothetical protein